MFKYTIVIGLAVAFTPAFFTGIKTDNIQVSKEEISVLNKPDQEDLLRELAERNILIKMAARQMEETSKVPELRMIADKIHDRHLALQIDIVQLAYACNVQLPTTLSSAMLQHLEQGRSNNGTTTESGLLSLIAGQKSRMEEIVGALHRLSPDDTVGSFCEEMKYRDVLRSEGIEGLANSHVSKI